MDTLHFFWCAAIGSRIAGLITVLFLLTEPGSNDVGGWFWLVDLGVWTAGLGMVPALIGTVRIADLFEKPAPRTAAAIAACVGLALLCHPLFLIYFGLAIPLLCASRYLSDEETPWRHALLWLGVATATGLCIASFWLVPYFSASAYAQQLGGVGSSISRLGAAVIGDTLFLGMHIPAMVLGLIGAIFLLRSRRTLPLFMGLFVFVCIAGASSTVVGLFGPGVTLWIKKHINSIRLLMLAKPFWYGSAAFLLVAAWNGAKRILIPQGSLRSSEQTSRHKWSRRTAMIIFGLAFVLPVVFPAARAFFQNEIRRPTVWHSQREDIPARQAFLAWAQEFRTGDPRFFRIAHGFDPNDNLTDLGIDLPWPLYKIGGTPTGHFKYNVASLSSQAMRAFNVRFALSEHPLTNRPDFALLRTFKQRLWLYEFRDWNPVPFEIIGEGPVELEDFRDEDIVLRAETGALGLLRLNVTYYPKWQATRDGVPVPITPVPIAWVEHSALMQVELKPGTYRFHYRKGASDYIGTILCLIGIAGCVALANWKRLSHTRARASGALPPA